MQRKIKARTLATLRLNILSLLVIFVSPVEIKALFTGFHFKKLLPCRCIASAVRLPQVCGNVEGKFKATLTRKAIDGVHLSSQIGIEIIGASIGGKTNELFSENHRFYSASHSHGHDPEDEFLPNPTLIQENPALTNRGFKLVQANSRQQIKQDMGEFTVFRPPFSYASIGMPKAKSFGLNQVGFACLEIDTEQALMFCKKVWLESKQDGPYKL